MVMFLTQATLRFVVRGSTNSFFRNLRAPSALKQHVSQETDGGISYRRNCVRTLLSKCSYIRALWIVVIWMWFVWSVHESSSLKNLQNSCNYEQLVILYHLGLVIHMCVYVRICIYIPLNLSFVHRSTWNDYPTETFQTWLDFRN